MKLIFEPKYEMGDCKISIKNNMNDYHKIDWIKKVNNNSCEYIERHGKGLYS
jgi:hypothetical protein